MSLIVDFNSYITLDKKKIKNLYELESEKIKTATIIVFNRKLLIRKYENIKNKKSLINVLENKLKEDLPITNNMLIDYSYNKNSNTLYVYTINDSIGINYIGQWCDKIKIYPIEFYIIKRIKFKTFMRKNYTILAKLKENIYLINIINNNIDSSYTYERIEDVKYQNIINKFLVIGTEISIKKEDLKKNTIKQIPIGEIIDNEIFI